MALVTPTVASFGDGRDNVFKITWVLTSTDTTGVGIGPEFVQHTDMTWHATGTWGGATAAVQGSNVDVDASYGSLKNAAGAAAITWTADGSPATQIERPFYVRPKLTTAGAGATVTVVLCARRNRKQA